MSDNFCPDYGVMMKESFPEVEVFFFYNLIISDISRVSPQEYSLFTNYEFAGKTFALSLDFGLDLLPVLIDIIKDSFSKSTLEAIIYRLVDPEIKANLIKLGLEVGDIGCEARLGELQFNVNESYIPLVVTRFF
jgi:hypothetical protein